MENIPDSIIELIGQQSFDELSEPQKEVVLKHLSAQEYDSLYVTHRILGQQNTELPPENTSQKRRLMDHFVSTKQSFRPLWNTPVQLWKAASIFILLGAGWLIHWQTYKHKQVQYVSQLDTVYLEKEIPVKVYDTVYYKEEERNAFVSHKPAQIPAEENRLKKDEADRNENYSEPVRRGIPAKDDSLIQSFKFVTL
jgi:hypothetical protein